jgi:hypothetical protein
MKTKNASLARSELKQLKSYVDQCRNQGWFCMRSPLFLKRQVKIDDWLIAAIKDARHKQKSV